MDSVPTLADLGSTPPPGTALAVLGHPIRHSISPAMHQSALAEMARLNPEYSTWTYGRFDVPPADLPQALDRLHALGYRGLNLTVPHKVLAFDRMVAIDPAARPIGAVNTLRWTAAGWHGYNTDGHGLATAVGETLGVSLRGATVVLLGAGGAARGAAVECLQRGCAALWIGNRTRENLDTLLALLRPIAGGSTLHGFSPERPPSDLPAGALVVNATSAGLKPQDAPPIDLGALPRPAGVYDMIYNPAVTPLLAQAARLGLPHANGLSMLIHQGARALEIWSGSTVPVPAMRRAAEQALGLAKP